MRRGSIGLGTVRVFLADGTLVMDSCFETYRLAPVPFVCPDLADSR